MKIESKIGRSSHSEEAIYAFLTDLRNFSGLVPADKIKDWAAGEDHCSFRIDPVGSIGMKILEKEPYKLVKIISDPERSSQKFMLWLQIKAVEEGDTRLKITIEPDMNRMMLSMIKGQIQKALDTVMDHVEGFNFSEG